jgi:exonuclease VII large subunit
MQSMMLFESSTRLISKKLFNTEKKLDYLSNVNIKKLNNYLDKKKTMIYDLHIKVNDFNPKQKIYYFNEKIKIINNNNLLYLKNKIKFYKQKISLLHRLLDSSSIDKNLKKGYAILQKDKKLIKDIESLRHINEFSIKMKDGSLIIKK